MNKEYVRRLVVFEDYFKEFRKTIGREALKKLYQVFTLIMVMPIVPAKYLKPIKGRKGLYEILSEYEGNEYRVFCCFDEGRLVILFNGIVKKSQKTPKEVLDKAESLMNMYYETKTLHQDE